MVRRLLLLATVLVAAALAGGCSGDPTRIGTSGIDGLVIPTPHPRPTDFSARVDNPWFPLATGSRWVYRCYTDTAIFGVTATVLPGVRRVAGVATTAVRYVVRYPHHRPEVAAVRWYAQDTAGNVWWFGQRTHGSTPVDPLATGSWRAGRDGAEAGLVMAAVPRDGDGYRNGYRRGVMERHATVTSLDATVALPSGRYHHVISTDDRSQVDPVLDVQSFYVRGRGLVAQQTVNGGDTQLELVRFRG